MLLITHIEKVQVLVFLENMELDQHPSVVVDYGIPPREERVEEHCLLGL